MMLGVVQLVGDDGVLGTEQGLGRVRQFGIEAGGCRDRVFGARKLRETAFQLFVDLGGTADEAYGCHAESPAMPAPAELRLIMAG